MSLKDEPGSAIENQGDVITPVSAGTGALSDVQLVQEEVAIRTSGGRNISRGRLVLRRVLRKKLALFGMFLLVAEIVLAFAGPAVSKWTVSGLDFNCLSGCSPGGSHWWGTDAPGPDTVGPTIRGTHKEPVVGP